MDGARVDHVAARDGTSLLLRHWPVPAGEPWATMLLVHGLAEHSGRYEHVGARLAEERVVALRSAAPARPLILFGHSLGGLVSLGYVLDGRSWPDMLVLSAPAIG